MKRNLHQASTSSVTSSPLRTFSIARGTRRRTTSSPGAPSTAPILARPRPARLYDCPVATMPNSYWRGEAWAARAERVLIGPTSRACELPSSKLFLKPLESLRQTA